MNNNRSFGQADCLALSVIISLNKSNGMKKVKE